MINLSSILIIIPIFLILVSEIRNKYLKNIFSLVFIAGLSLMIFEISIERKTNHTELITKQIIINMK